MTKQGEDLALLHEVLSLLESGAALNPKYEDHPLHGKLVGKRDCHITPDWVLIYALDKTTLTLYRTGTHAEIYG